MKALIVASLIFAAPALFAAQCTEYSADLGQPAQRISIITRISEESSNKGYANAQTSVSGVTSALCAGAFDPRHNSVCGLSVENVVRVQSGSCD